jgi:hypothetical protein
LGWTVGTDGSRGLCDGDMYDMRADVYHTVAQVVPTNKANKTEADDDGLS